MWDYDYFREHYNTELDPLSEMLFRASSMGSDTYDYDARGAWLEAQVRPMQSANGHYPDIYKKPNHPTFSDQSIYHGANDWYGGSWVRMQDGFQGFRPGITNVYPQEDLQQYMLQREPTVILLPRW